MAVQEHFRTPEGFFDFELRGALSEKAGYFRFGSDTTCYGRRWVGAPAESGGSEPYDALQDVQTNGAKFLVPFDPTEVTDNLRRERYVEVRRNGSGGLFRKAYYFLRPALSVSLRKYAQRMSLRGWDRRSFPSWPVDRAVDRIFERLMFLTLKARGLEAVPFIWFWPEGKPGCAVMTHDVETASGLRFCGALMDLNDSFDVKSSFQIIPGGRYTPTEELRAAVRQRGFEINVHDWNHDGSLFSDREMFLKRAAKINGVGALWKADGFRSAVLYRNSEWYDTFTFSYDMSVPNVGHLDPQQGGCCTVMPYFIGRILEIPVTTTQDYSLFHILNDYSLDLWKRQVGAILEGNGLASFIVHPDYLRKERALATYTKLLEFLCRLRAEQDVWIARPQDVNRWWRERSQMKLVREGDDWQIDGPGKEQARVAYAQIQDGRLVYTTVAPRATAMA